MLTHTFNCLISLGKAHDQPHLWNTIVTELSPRKKDTAMRQNAVARFDGMHASSHAKGRLTRARTRSSATHDATWLGCVPLTTAELSLYDTHTIGYSSRRLPDGGR
jgi:hypothetical protein